MIAVLTKEQAYKLDKDMVVSNYDVGYGDGFLRINENQKYFTPKGYELLGRVSMDNISLNSNEDEICLFNDVRALAMLHNTISYEITTTLSNRIKKEVI